MHHLPEVVLSVIRLCVWFLLLAVIFIPLEHLFAAKPAKTFRAGFLTDMGYYLLSGLVPAVVLSLLLGGIAEAVHQVLPNSIGTIIAQAPAWLRATAALLVCELGFYWGHRWCHTVPLLWRFHAIHHSAPHVDWLVNTRAHPVDLIFTRLCGLAPLYVLGLAMPFNTNTTLMPVLVTLAGTVWGFFIHANVRWRFGKLEWLISTPGFHHWHHTNDDPAVINKNFAPLFPWIDRIFGTLYLPPDRHPEIYGIPEALAPTLVGQLLTPLGLGSRRSAAQRVQDPVADTP